MGCQFNSGGTVLFWVLLYLRKINLAPINSAVYTGLFTTVSGAVTSSHFPGADPVSSCIYKKRLINYLIQFIYVFSKLFEANAHPDLLRYKIKSVLDGRPIADLK